MDRCTKAREDAVQRIDHEHRRVQGAILVGVGEDDDRVLAAEFEMHALQRRRALTHDMRAGGCFSHEGDRLDGGMFGQRLARAFAEAVHEVDDAVGAAVAADFGIHDLREDHGA
jgi:hypothetical protein